MNGEKPTVEAEPDVEEPTVGGWQVVLSIVMNGDLGTIGEDKAQDKLIVKMTLLVAEMRDLFPGRIDIATLTPCIIGSGEEEI